MSPRTYANKKEMESDDALWQEHPSLVSYQDFYDEKTGTQAARIITYHRRAEEWDEESNGMVMVDLYSTPKSQAPKKA